MMATVRRHDVVKYGDSASNVEFQAGMDYSKFFGQVLKKTAQRLITAPSLRRNNMRQR